MFWDRLLHKPKIQSAAYRMITIIHGSSFPTSLLSVWKKSRFRMLDIFNSSAVSQLSRVKMS